MAEASGDTHARMPGMCWLGCSVALEAKAYFWEWKLDLDFISGLALSVTSCVLLAKSLLSEPQFLQMYRESGKLEQASASFQCVAFLTFCERRPGGLGYGCSAASLSPQRSLQGPHRVGVCYVWLW